MYSNIARIEVSEILKRNKGIYGMYSFEDIEGPESLYDDTFAELCSIYLDLYKHNFPFIKYTPEPVDALPEVIEKLKEYALSQVVDIVLDDLMDLEDEGAFLATSKRANISFTTDSNFTITIYLEEDGFEGEDYLYYNIRKLQIILNSDKGTRELLVDIKDTNITQRLLAETKKLI